MPEVCRWLTDKKQRKTNFCLTEQQQSDTIWRDYRALNQNWSYQPTLVGRAIIPYTIIVSQTITVTMIFGAYV